MHKSDALFPRNLYWGTKTASKCIDSQSAINNKEKKPVKNSYFPQWNYDKTLEITMSRADTLEPFFFFEKTIAMSHRLLDSMEYMYYEIKLTPTEF